jgi:hypothetical protein
MERIIMKKNANRRRKTFIVGLLGAIVPSVCLLLTSTAGHGFVNNCVQPPSGMISWWPADGDANDLVASNHGTLQNGASFASGMVAQAFSFDGVDDHISTEDIDLPSTFTLDAWIFPNTTDGVQYILSKDDDFLRSYFFCFDSGGKLVASVKNTAGAFTQYRTTEVVLSVGQWQHVVLTYDGSLGADQKMSFYVNGQNAAATHIGPYDAGGTPENNDLIVRLGIYGDGIRSPFNGLIDEVEIFNRVLATNEIVALFNAGSAGKCKTVTVCHKPGTPAQKTLVIPKQALAGHLGHGDTKGGCK